MEKALKILRLLAIALLLVVTAEWFALMPRYTSPSPVGFKYVLIGLTPLLFAPFGMAIGFLFGLIPIKNKSYKQKVELWTYLFAILFASIVALAIGGVLFGTHYYQ